MSLLCMRMQPARLECPTGQWLHSTESYSTELTSAVNVVRGTSRPYVDIPAANVLVGSQLGDASPVHNTLNIGGSSAGQSSRNNTTWETVSLAHFYLGAHHLMKLKARSFLECLSTRSASNTLGVFSYNSLADLAANRPSTFRRSLSTPTAASPSQWLGDASVGDLWQVTPNLQVQPGLRLEMNRYLSHPMENPLVATTFGLSNSRVPNAVHVSPRLGFAWTYSQSRANNTAGNPTVGYVQLPARGVLTGGIGEFRSEMHASSLTGPITSTGLANGTAQLLCTGVAAPASNWERVRKRPRQRSSDMRRRQLSDID